MRQAKRRRPQAGLALLGVFCLAFWAGTGLFLRTGWRTVGVALYDQLGDSSQLTGFTLSGALDWSGNEANRLHFTLQDGVLQTRLQLDDPAVVNDAQKQREIQVSQSYVLPPDRRAAVDEAAVVNLPALDGNRQANGTTDVVRRMYTLSLPDHTLLRISAGDTAVESPLTATATELYPQDDVSYHDYACWPGANDPVWDSWPASPVDLHPFVLGAGYGVCWTRDTPGRAPGLYRAAGLTQPQVAALPADGTVQGYPVLCGSTEYGTLTPFYCPDDAWMALAGTSMADGSTLLVYLDGEGMLCADLVNAAGQCTDHRELQALGTPDRVQTTLLPRRTSGDALLLLQPLERMDEASSGAAYGGGPGQVAVLRAEDGRFTVTDLFTQDFGGTIQAACLNTDGTGLLLGYDAPPLPEGSQTARRSDPTTLNLRVYDLDTGQMTYLGRVATGSERDWGITGQYRYLIYDTLEEDGGDLP